jgi:hypothetical protein
VAKGMDISMHQSTFDSSLFLVLVKIQSSTSANIRYIRSQDQIQTMPVGLNFFVRNKSRWEKERHCFSILKIVLGTVTINKMVVKNGQLFICLAINPRKLQQKIILVIILILDNVYD